MVDAVCMSSIESPMVVGVSDRKGALKLGIDVDFDIPHPSDMVEGRAVHFAQWESHL